MAQLARVLLFMLEESIMAGQLLQVLCLFFRYPLTATAFDVCLAHPVEQG